MPALIANHQKKVVESRVKKFYSVINQAVIMSEVDNGSYEFWDYPVDNDSDAMEEFFNRYFAKYINTLKITDSSTYRIDNDGNQTDELQNSIIVYLTDGSAIQMRASAGIDIAFYPNASKIGNITKSQREVFSFNFNKSNANGIKSSVEPYTAGWDGTTENLINNTRYGCRHNSPTYSYCAKLLQLNNWQITKDYPW